MSQWKYLATKIYLISLSFNIVDKFKINIYLEYEAMYAYHTPKQVESPSSQSYRERFETVMWWWWTENRFALFVQVVFILYDVDTLHTKSLTKSC